MKLGKYGKFFEGMDGGKILDCLEKYGVEKENEIIEFRAKQSQENKLSSKEINEALLPVLKNVVSKLDVSEKKIIPKPIREKSDNEKRFDSWMRQFDKIHLRQEHTLGGVRFVKRYGKMLNINSFLEYKLNQYNTYKK